MAMRVPMRLTMRTRNPAVLGALHFGGTDGGASVSPFRGSINRPDGPSTKDAFRAERPTVIWIVVLSAACVATTLTLFGAGYDLPLWWQVVALAVVTAVAERQSVRLSRNVETSVAFLPFVFTAVAFGPLAALVVGVL